MTTSDLIDSATHARRTLVRVTDRRDLGADQQVDNKGLLFVPTAPELTDPFLALVDDSMSSPGFDWHPHRGLQTVTTVLDGVLEHGDNLGHTGALVAGEVQWMTAGSGIIHREMAFRNERARVLQMWLNMPAVDKMIDPGYQDLTVADLGRLRRPGISVDVHVGTVAGVTGRARAYSPVQGVVATLDPEADWDLGVPVEHRLFAHVVSGTVRVGGRTLTEGQIGWSDPVADPRVAGSTLTLTGVDPAQPSVIMVYSGTPLHETVALSGPFVMNTDAQLESAYRDYRTGKFGPVPRTARLEHVI
ncbi:pirin family protein [Actinomycetes bacterium M1A6_2h]